MLCSIRYSTKVKRLQLRLRCVVQAALSAIWSVIAGMLQIIETVVGIGVIRAAVSKSGPLEDEIFKLDIRSTSVNFLCC